MEYSRSQIFYFLVIGFALGILFHSFFDLGLAFSMLVIFVSAACYAFSYFCEERSFKKIIFITSLFILFFGLGNLRYDISNFDGPDNLSNYLGNKVLIEGVIIDEPSPGENSLRLTVLADSFSGGSDKKNSADLDGETISEKVLVTTNLFPEFKYGDRVRVEGKIDRPKNFEGGNGKVFDYASFLEKDDIEYSISFSSVVLLGSGGGNAVKEKLFSFKNALIKNLENVLPEPHSSLASGVLVGGKNSLGKDLENDFRKAGIIHIIVLSGYNIMIVAEGIMKVFSFLPKSGGFFAGGASIILFAIMTGGSATVVRASIMSLLAIYGRWSGRTYLVTRALFFAGFIMLIHNPKILVFDFSFELSFLASLGLIYFSPIIERKIIFLPKKYKIREYAVSTIATQIIVFPLLLYRMGEISLVSLPVNMLILFFVPWTMLASFLTGMSAFISHFLAWPFAALTYVLTQYELGVVALFSKVPLASIKIDYFPLWISIVIYLIYGLVFYKIAGRKFFASMEKTPMSDDVTRLNSF